MSATYRVARAPCRILHWWAPGEAIPANYTETRLATAKEVALMERIRLHKNPPLVWSQQLSAMLHDNHGADA